jgi:hypothetical protein
MNTLEILGSERLGASTRNVNLFAKARLAEWRGMDID